MLTTILVTGASGFVGSHLIGALASTGIRVRALVRVASVPSVARRFPMVEIVPGDLLESEAVQRACRGTVGVVHCAALMADADWAGRREFYRINVEGTRGLLAAAAAERVGRFIHISTVGVLGSPSRIPADETTPYGTDLSLYEWSKREAEKLVLGVLASGRLKGCVLRPAQMYGPGMAYGWADTVRAIRKGSMRLIGHGNALIHLTHVNDVVDVVSSVFHHPAGESGDVFHIAGPEVLPIRQVFETLAALVQAKPPSRIPYAIAYASAAALSLVPCGLRPGRLRLLTPHRVKFFVRDHAYDITKAKTVLGFFPKVTVRDGFSAWIADGLGGLTRD